MKEFSLAAVDFEEVLNRLTMHAQNLFTGAVCTALDEVVLPGGEDAGNLASATLLKFLDPLDKSVTWSVHRGQPSTAGVLAYLRRVLERDFLDLKKSSRYKTTVYLHAYSDEDGEGKKGTTLDQLAVIFETPEGKTLKCERREWILKQFDAEPELKEIVTLQLEPEGYNAFSNRELAQLLDTTVGDIENRKKRIKLRLTKLAASRGTEEAEHV